MLRFRRWRKRRAIPSALAAECRNHPDQMYLAPTFIAVYHSGIDQVLIIPIDDMNPNMTDEEANALLIAHLELYNARIK